MAIKVVDMQVHSDRTPTQEEVVAGVRYITGGALRHPDLPDARISDPVLRLALAKNEGNISVTIMPGERLGQLSVDVGFEGKSGEHEFCLAEQDDLLQHAAEWLNELLSGFGCDFEVAIEALPCPSALARLQIESAARRLASGQVTSKTGVRPSRPDRKVERKK